MRLQLEEITRELKMRLESDKSIRNCTYLKNALSELEKYKRFSEKPL